jgi:hypothetical protein
LALLFPALTSALSMFGEELLSVRGEDFIGCGVKNSVFDLQTTRVVRVALIGGE